MKKIKQENILSFTIKFASNISLFITFDQHLQYLLIYLLLLPLALFTIHVLLIIHFLKLSLIKFMCYFGVTERDLSHLLSL